MQREREGKRERRPNLNNQQLKYQQLNYTKQRKGQKPNVMKNQGPGLRGVAQDFLGPLDVKRDWFCVWRNILDLHSSASYDVV